jgi:hypothetical protein
MKKALIFTGVLLLTACVEIFVPDPVALRIPRYSEKGYQVAGAFVNEVAWKTEFDCMLFGGCSFPLQISTNPAAEQVLLEFDGDIQEGIQKGKKLLLRFRLIGPNITRLSELTRLEGQKFSIETGELQAEAGDYDTSISCQRGQLLIRRVSAEKSEVNGNFGYIIAGTFGLECEQDGERLNIYQGRYDFAVSNLFTLYDSLAADDQ